MSSSSLMVIVLVPSIYPTMCSRSFVAICSGIWDGFNTFTGASQCAFNDSKRDKMEICAGKLLNCLTTEYSLLLTVLMNSMFRSSPTLFFFCRSSTKTSFRFLLFLLHRLGHLSCKLAQFGSYSLLWWALVLLILTMFWGRDFGSLRRATGYDWVSRGGNQRNITFCDADTHYSACGGGGGGGGWFISYSRSTGKFQLIPCKGKIWGSDCMNSKGLVPLFLVSNCYCSIADGILDFIPKGPAVTGTVPWGIHVIGTTGVLVIIFRWRAGYGLRSDPSNETGIP